MRIRGVIHNIRDTYGFIVDPATRTQYFFIPSCLQSPLTLDELKIGDAVDFDVVESDRGLRAANVTPATVIDLVD